MAIFDVLLAVLWLAAAAFAVAAYRADRKREAQE